MKPRKINLFLLFKLPAAFFCGVRVQHIDTSSCTTKVRHRWINQNPFRSMFWAVQGMAAELSTGAMVMSSIRDMNMPISMLVLNNKGTFLKKATGKIVFSCTDGVRIREAMDLAVSSGEGQTIWLKSEGTNRAGDVVSRFEFEWTLKVKNKN